MATLSINKIQVQKYIIDRSDWVKYYVLPLWHVRQLGDAIEREPDARFNEFVEQHVRAYLDGKAPPEAIQSAVMNVADGFVSAGAMTIRAGDYIALQNEFRAK